MNPINVYTLVVFDDAVQLISGFKLILLIDQIQCLEYPLSNIILEFKRNANVQLKQSDLCYYTSVLIIFITPIEPRRNVMRNFFSRENNRLEFSTV